MYNYAYNATGKHLIMLIMYTGPVTPAIVRPVGQ